MNYVLCRYGNWYICKDFNEPVLITTRITKLQQNNFTD